MRTHVELVRRHRKTTGSSISEFGPVLFVVLLFICFPLLDLIALGLEYCCGSMLNHTQLREAAVTKATSARKDDGPIKKTCVDQWQANGIGKFTKIVGNVTTKVNYLSTGIAGSKDAVVELVTTMTVSPFLTIPFLPLPGCGAPVTFTYRTQNLLEDPRNFDLTKDQGGTQVPATLPDNET